jgi:hypothetical protein
VEGPVTTQAWLITVADYGHPEDQDKPRAASRSALTKPVDPTELQCRVG